MKNLHYGPCLVGVAVALAVMVSLGVKASTLGILAIALACPLMMLVMMKAMTGDQSASSRHDDHPVDVTRSGRTG